MQIDSHTLQDLDILNTRDAAASLFEWAKCTCTRGGERRLLERFKHPQSDADEIRSTQQAVRFLVQYDLLLDHLLSGSNWLGVEHYISTAYRELDHPNRLYLNLGSWWLRLRHNDILEQIRVALSMLQLVLREANRVLAAMQPLNPPVLISGWIRDVELVLESPVLQNLAEGKEVYRRSFPRLLALDWSLRSSEFSPVRQLAKLIYEIDALRSLARATQKHRLVLPQILDREAPFIEAHGLYHPNVRSAVGNPIDISAASRLLFITGPNTAGKSTYLKAVGVAVFFAQLGMGVPATQMRLVPFGCLFSGINTTDNVLLGQSYFIREVRRVREIAEILSRHVSALVLFDEMFKGTNLKDAADGCTAVLSRFAACPGSAFLVASHLAELADELKHLEAVQFLHFAAEVVDQAVRCSYELRPGVSSQRLGMYILEQQGVLRLLERQRVRAV